MAKPVFAENKNALLAKLRLSPDVSEGGKAVIDEAMLQVRTVIYSALGSTRVAEIVVAGYNEEATTNAQILRLKAAQVELWGIKAYLLRDAPAFFLDAKNDAEEAWNDEDLLRNANTDEDAINYYEGKFLAGLNELETGDEPSSSGIKIRTFSPDNDAQKIAGKSITSGDGLGGLYP